MCFPVCLVAELRPLHMNVKLAVRASAPMGLTAMPLVTLANLKAYYFREVDGADEARTVSFQRRRGSSHVPRTAHRVRERESCQCQGILVTPPPPALPAVPLCVL